MRLNDYLSARNESQAAFAARAGVGARTVFRAVKGELVGSRSIQRIVEAAQSAPAPCGQAVEVSDLIPLQGDAA